MFWKKVNKNKTDRKFLHNNHLNDVLHGRLSILIDFYNDSSATKKSLQRSVYRELNRFEITNDNISIEIQKLLNNNNLKY